MLAFSFLAMTVFNASWLAPTPRGGVKLIAHRGVMQQFGRANSAATACTATLIEQPVTDLIENTAPSLYQAQRLGAQMIEIDVAQSADGQLVLFHDEDLGCRTDGTGKITAATLARLKALDAGYGYSADGGKTFPLRGKGKALIPTLDEALAAAPQTALLYNLRGTDPVLGERLVAALKAAGRDPAERRDGFSGPATILAPIRAAWPKVWSYSDDAVEACTRSYLSQGWLGLTPATCQNGTIAIPLNRQFLFAGWPNRLIARMEAAGAHVLLIGPTGAHKPMGLDLPEQIGDIPVGFNGFVWVDDIYAIGPALHPALNKRNPVEQAELLREIERRRKARD
ncbi:glycerophosphodiester phosphodiesterase family protein [Novosphingobium sp.]|uniref:glycerophosphodiester phosphodiesterase family protein n=1 Tax=Novosphingobium sp. TaxID=1874826 RepID=UPI0025FA58F0|nr:glycerophosphodiester phosphodiesterase family protein [Novosphingobium sp.]